MLRNITDTGARALSAAVIMQSAKDYVNAQKKLKNPDLDDETRSKYQGRIIEIERFLKSNYAEMYVEIADLHISPEKLLDKLKTMEAIK